MSDNQAFALHNVEIDRSNSSVITTEVPKHEIEVLRAVHGRAAVRDLGPADDEIELNIGADAEWVRLQRRYKRINAPDPVALAYRAGPRDLEEFGFELGRAGATEAPQSSVKKHKPAKAEPAKAEPKGKKAE